MCSVMSELLPILAAFSAIVALSLVLLLAAAPLFTKIRKKLRVKVNCWFCNQWTKVLYEERNRFNCPNCTQYNGFDENGHYNKEIPAQYDELLNFRSPQSKNGKQEIASNGLCRLCNNNQQLKVYQLANFVPLYEENYDVEIEHFRKQLEKAYELCSDCDKCVKRTITTQNKWMLGLKIKQLRQQGVDTLINLNNKTQQLLNKPKKSFFLSFLDSFVITFASLILLNAVYSTGIFDQNPKEYVSLYYNYAKTNFFSYLKIVNNSVHDLFQSSSYENLEVLTLDSYNSMHKIKNVFLNVISNGSLTQYNFSKCFIEDIPKLNVSILNLNSLSISGLFLQVVILVCSKKNVFKYALLCLWSLLVLLSFQGYKNPISYIAQAFVTLLIIIVIARERKNSTSQKQNEEEVNNYWSSVSNLSTTLPLQILHNNSLVVNPAPKSKISDTNDIDTADSDCSFESIISQSTMKTCLNKIVDSTLSNADVFSGPAVFRNFLTPPPSMFNYKTDTSAFIKVKPTRSIMSEPINYERNASFSRRNSGIDSYLNQSLDNLHIDKSKNLNHQFKTKKKKSINGYRSAIKRPLISPPRFTGIHDYKANDYINTNVSRSSSQSSGFMSQAPVTSSPNNSICSDFDYGSLFSEPTLHSSRFFNHPRSELNFSLNTAPSVLSYKILSLGLQNSSFMNR